MHTFFFTMSVFLAVLALSGAVAYFEGWRHRRRHGGGLPAWLDLDGSARRSVETGRRWMA